MTDFPTTTQRTTRLQRVINYIFVTALLIVLVVFSYWMGRSQAYTDAPVQLDRAYMVNVDPPTTEKALVDFGLFWDAWRVLKERYVDHDMIKAQDLIYGAIDGMLAATGDPYTTFFDPEELASFNEEVTGTFEGIGAEIGMRNGVLTIIAPLDDSPAQKAGLRAGDMIVRIGETLTNTLSIDEAVRRIRGKGGTTVVLTIYRDGENDTREVRVVRDKIVVKSVTMTVKRGMVAVVRVRRFGPQTAEAFSQVANKIAHDASIRALIIDVRNNPGGYLTSAITIASTMLPQGRTVVISEDSNNNREIFRAHGDNILGSLPIIVLINGGSASASEILTGALRDNRDDVVIVGEHSFGKGSVQELVPLKRGAVKVTIAKWLTPNGDQINKVGIAPQEEVVMTNEDFLQNRDPQMERALEIAVKRAQ